MYAYVVWKINRIIRKLIYEYLRFNDKLTVCVYASSLGTDDVTRTAFQCSSTEYRLQTCKLIVWARYSPPAVKKFSFLQHEKNLLKKSQEHFNLLIFAKKLQVRTYKAQLRLRNFFAIKVRIGGGKEKEIKIYPKML